MTDIFKAMHDLYMIDKQRTRIMITIEELRSIKDQYLTDGITPASGETLREVIELAISQHEEIERLRNLASNFATLVEMHAFTIPAPNPYTPRLLEAVVVARAQLAAIKSGEPK